MITWEAPLSTNAVDTVRWRWIDGKPFPYPSVTSCLDIIVPDGLKKWFINTDGATVRKVSEEAAARGEKIHSIIEDINSGRNPAIDNAYASIIREYKNFLSEVRPEFIEIEKTLYHEDYGYCGRCDCIVKIGDKIELWDFKTGRISTSTGWQLGAYKLAAERMGLTIDGMKAISVNPRLNKVEVYNYEHFDFCSTMFLKSFDLFKAIYFNTLKRGISVPNKEKVAFPVEWLTLDTARDFANLRANETKNR